MAEESPEERKIVTALFADLVESTRLAVQRDPEQLRALLWAFFEEMAQQIRSFGGTVEKYQGDAIMAVFGVPRVHEDDAERAVRAAVGMQQALADLNPTLEAEYGTRLELRVGIATGDAVASTREDRELMVTGPVANLASRLQSVGHGIVVSAETQQLLEPLLEGAPLGPLDLKGFPEPMPAFGVTGLRPGAPRRVSPFRSTFVGRDGEIGTLRGCLDKLERGLGQIVSITGDAGAGKSRLVAELREQLPDGVRWVEGRCESYTQQIGYAPVGQALRALLQMRGGEPPTVARMKLRAALEPLLGERYPEVQAAIARLLGAERPPERLEAIALDPPSLRSQVLLTMRTLLEAMAKRRPLVLALEDLHWADQASLELIGVLFGVTDFAPVMILMTSRPDPEGGAWELSFRAQRSHPHRLTELQLGALAGEAADRLLQDLLPGAGLPERLQEQIHAHAEGNPLYIEEVVQTLIERGVVRRDGARWVAEGDLSSIPVPETVRGVIGARVDRLAPDAKRILQRAAVVGRTFTRRALQALGGNDELVDPPLVDLLRAGLVRERTRLPEPEYEFKHALTQEAAYASILVGERRRLHEATAIYLTTTLGDPTGESAAQLARHWLGAGDADRALEYTLRAAERASLLHALPEVIAHSWQALDLLEVLEDTPERSRSRAQAVLAMVGVDQWITYRGVEEALRQLDRAIAAAQEIEDLASLAQLEIRKAHYEAARFLPESRSRDPQLSRRARAHAEESGDRQAQGVVAYMTARMLGVGGEYEAALPLIDEAIEILLASGQKAMCASVELVEARLCFTRAGRLDESLRHTARGREVADALQDARLRAWAATEAETYLYKGLLDDAVRVGEEGLAFALDIAEWVVVLFASAWLGLAYTRLGRPEAAWRVLSRALREVPEKRRHRWAMIYVEIALSQYHLLREELEQARAAAERASELTQTAVLRKDLGAASRTRGQVCAAMGERAEARRAFQQSLDVLDEIPSPPELAQTLLAYGRFAADYDPREARRSIERALALFEEMNATGWIAEARAALG